MYSNNFEKQDKTEIDLQLTDLKIDVTQAIFSLSGEIPFAMLIC